MARFDIISKDGETLRFSGKPRYIGSYLKPSYLEFSEIASPTPIAWEAGDYVDYPRTGMRYRLYSVPQASKNARKGSHGRAFTYSNVQLHAATKELEIAPFRDLVGSDNGVHFSTSPDVATFEDVYGIARRIQACMDDLYPKRWKIRVADFNAAEDSDIIEKITEAKDFALSGGTCLDALSKIYELWQDIGWMHSYEDGVEIITIGYANKRIAENTSDPYLYGKGLGLTAIKKNQTNKDEFATRLYVYGSERNLPSRYYNGKKILNAESVDIRNLMLPLDWWGHTNGLPDARKAYLENAEAVAKFGVIPKTHYFDSDDAGGNIYPSISGMTIGMVRKALADMNITDYSPSKSVYLNESERVDEIQSAANPADDGVLNKGGKQFEEVKDIDISGQGSFSISSTTWAREFTIVETSFAKSGIGEVSIAPDMNIIVIGENLQTVKIRFDLADQDSIKFRSVVDSKTVSGVQSETNSASWSVKIPSLSIRQEKTAAFPVYLTIRVEIITEDTTERNITIRRPSSPLEFRYARVLESTFRLTLKQVGFDIDKQASLGEGKVISMKTGACAGRNFEISACRYQSASDTWAVDCKRQHDDTLGMLFPNADYPIVASDRFVLLEIAMPESYIRVAMERLLAEGQKLLARASKVQNHYEPSVDAKVMAESGRILREGMFMEISDSDVIEGGTEHILIDTLSIYEDESAIPTYKVTLRERRKVTYKGTPSSTSPTNTKSVEVPKDNTIDLSEYAKTEDVEKADNEIRGRLSDLEGYWALEDGVLKTRYPILTKGYAASAVATVGEGGSGAIINKESIIAALGYTPYDAANPAGYITVTALTGYATTQWVLNQNYLTGASLAPYAKSSDVAKTYATISSLSELQRLHSALRDEFNALESALNDDVAGKINTWNEIVDFVDEYSGSEDLSTLLSKIEGKITVLNTTVKDHETRIESLEGMWYIEDGVLKTRYPILTKSYAASAVATVGEGGGGVILNKDSIIEALGYTPYDSANPAGYIDDSALSEYAKTADIDSLYATKAMLATTNLNVNLLTTRVSKIEASLNDRHSLTIFNSEGLSSISYDGSEAKSLTLTKSWVGLGNVTNLAASEYLTALTSDSTDAVSITVGGTTKIITTETMKASLGLKSLAYKDVLAVSDIPDLSGKYLPLTGGNINGTLAMVSGSKIQFYTPSSAYAGTLGVDSGKNLFWYNNGAYNTIYHSGNFNPANYLPLTGGTIKGVSPYHQYVLTLDTDNAYYTILRLRSQGNNRGYFAWANDVTVFQGVFIRNTTTTDVLGLSDSGVPMYNKNTLLHSGNGIIHKDIEQDDTPTVNTFGLWNNVGAYFSVGYSDAYKMEFRGAGRLAYMRVCHGSGSDTGWKAIALTDQVLLLDGSNVMVGPIRWNPNNMLTAASSQQGSGLELYKIIDEAISPNGSPYWSTLSAITTYAGFQISAHGGTIMNPYYRKMRDSGDWSNWEKIAFTSDLDNYLPLSGGTMNENATIHWGANNTEDYTAFQSGFRLLQYNTATSQYRGGIHVGTYYGWQMTRTNQVNVLQFRGYDRDNTQWTDWKTIAFTDSDITGNAATASALKITPRVNADNVIHGALFSSYYESNAPTGVYRYLTGITLATNNDPAYKLQLALDYTGKVFSRNQYNNVWNDWKQLAFTDSTVAAANKLVTSAGASIVQIGDTGNLLVGQGTAKESKDTYIYGNNIALCYGTAGSILNTAIHIDSSGNVTIGNSDLAGTNFKLYVDGVAATPLLRFVNNDGTTGSYIGRPSLGHDNILLYIPTANDFYIATNGTERMRINSSGNVTIGATDKLTDSATTKLYVDGGIRFAPRTLWGQSFDGTADVSGSLTIYKNSSDYTANWARHTHVRDSANTILSTFGFYGKGDVLEYTYIGPSYASPLVSIRPSGNVGIGVVYPEFKLDVAGTARINGNVLIGNDYGVVSYTAGNSSAIQLVGISTNNTFFVGTQACTALGVPTRVYGKDITLYTGVDSASAALLVNSSGNVTLGVSTDSAADTYGLYVGKVLPSYFANRVLINGVTDDGSSALSVRGALKVCRTTLPTDTFLEVTSNDVIVKYMGYDNSDGYCSHDFYSHDKLLLHISANNAASKFYTQLEVSGRIFAGDGLVIPASRTLKIGDATISYQDGVLKVDKPFMSLGYAAGATATATEGGGAIINKDSIIEALGYTPYDSANPSGYITASSIPTSLPASDVYAWAKASTKPSYTWSEIGSKPSFATVATSGKYSDLSGLPTIPTSLKNPYSLKIFNSTGLSSVSYDGSEARSVTITKSWVGLSNVENVALSSWTGSENITTLGTITKGTWNGDKIQNSSLAYCYIYLAGELVVLGDSVTADTLKTNLGLADYATKAYVDGNFLTGIISDPAETHDYVHLYFGKLGNSGEFGVDLIIRDDIAGASEETDSSLANGTYNNGLCTALGVKNYVEGMLEDLGGNTYDLADINNKLLARINNGVNVAVCSAATALNFKARPKNSALPCVVHIVKSSTVLITIPPLETSNCRMVATSGAAATSVVAVPGYMGVTLVWNPTSACWEGFLNN